MKKAYAKVKETNVKSILKRPYIAATIIGALLCAVILSVSLPREVKEPAPSVQPEEVVRVETPEVLVPTEPSTQKPSVPEVDAPEKNDEVLASGKEEVEKTETEAAEVFAKTGENIVMQKPLEGEVSKAYSNGKPVKNETMGDWRLHTGVDIAGDRGAEVKAPADGSVIRAEKDPLTGYTVSIDHGNGVVSTIYNLEETKDVKVGQAVKKGDKIGSVGESAPIEMLDDPHIHFEVKVNGEFQSPENFYK